MFDLVLAAYVCYVVWRLCADKPVEAIFWFYVSRDWQLAAKFFGELGMEAECLYHEAMEKVRLS